MNPMQAASTAKKPIVTPEQIKTIFSICETLYSYHAMLLEVRSAFLMSPIHPLLIAS